MSEETYVDVEGKAKPLPDLKKEKKKVAAKKEAAKKEAAKKKKKKVSPAKAEEKDAQVVTADVVEPEPVTTPSIMPAKGEVGRPRREMPPVSEELLEHCDEAMEALEDLEDDMRLPIIKLTNDGFEMTKGGEPIEEFTGIVIYSKRSNVYYAKKFDAANVEAPDCMSSNGKVPDPQTDEAKKNISDKCKTCPKNQFGSDRAGGKGKDCKNTRPMFILVDIVGGEGMTVIPMVLRIPPTSLPAANEFIINGAREMGSLYSFRTKFKIYKKDEAQAYYNISFSAISSKFNDQDKVDVQHIRKQWMPFMSQGMFGIDVDALEPEAAPTTVVSAQGDTGDIDY